MEAPTREESFLRRKKMTKQLTGKRGDTPLHSAARAGNLSEIKAIFSGSSGNEDIKEVLEKPNQYGETALYVAAEYGYVDVVEEMIKHYDIGSASIRARNGYDAFHIAAKQGDLEVVKILLTALPGLAMTVDLSNTTALHTAATQGHTEVVNFLLEQDGNVAKIAKSNGKTALHSAARNGHNQGYQPGRIRRGQTKPHMAVKGSKIELVEELIRLDPSLVNMVDSKGNTALHIATRKGRVQEPIQKLLTVKGNFPRHCSSNGNSEIRAILQEYGVQSASSLKPKPMAKELKQTVSDIKHEVHYQLEHTRQTRKQGLNNAINSTTVVVVLIATVAFAAIFQVPGQFVTDPDNIPPGLELGEANIAADVPFMIFFLFDSFALFISLAVVVVQTSVVIIERKAKKQMMAVINKLMWLACVLISVAFLALAFVVVVTIIGTVIMATTLGLMCYWVIRHRIEASNLRSIRRNSMGSRSRSWSMSAASDTELTDYKKMYAI
ncbi:hypothetical protein MKW92_029113 [Papaver armeniacum]|nr:hypothetical protein MKW92_029113 [Papaver armeniacum]